MSFSIRFITSLLAGKILFVKKGLFLSSIKISSIYFRFLVPGPLFPFCCICGTCELLKKIIPARNVSMIWIRKNIIGLAKIHVINGKGDFVEKIVPTRNKRWAVQKVTVVEIFAKNFTCKECKDEKNRKGYLFKHQYSCMKLLVFCWDSCGK